VSSSQNDGLGFSPNLQSVHSHADVVPQVCSGYALAIGANLVWLLKTLLVL
jgi:hypothetical protein